MKFIPRTARYGHTIRRRLSNHSAKSTSSLPQPRLDYRSIAENIAFKSHNASNRKASLPVGAVQSAAHLYTELKQLSGQLNQKLALRNVTSDLVRTSSSDTAAKSVAIEQAKTLKFDISKLKARLVTVESELLSNALRIPNDTHPDAPIGPESAAVILSTHGPEPLPVTSLRDHVRVARALDMLDLEAASIVTGSSWYFLLNEGALLELALTNYALSVAIKHGYRPVATPDVVREDIAVRCGFQPRDPMGNAHQMYHLASESDKEPPQLVLSGTAEIPLAGLFANKVIEEAQLPIKVVGVGKAFRAEAGARGVDTRGLYRVHQFSKVELFTVGSGADSDAMMEDMRKVQVEILDGLGVPFRVLDMPTEELGASAYRKYDIEAWMPGRGRWGEVTSTSNCTDYQSRRLHIRYRRETALSDGPFSSSQFPSFSARPRAETQDPMPPRHSPSPPERQPRPFTHTLNGTAAAIPRLIVALLENGVRLQGEDVMGLDLPSVLRPFWIGGTGDGGREKARICWV